MTLHSPGLSSVSLITPFYLFCQNSLSLPILHTLVFLGVMSWPSSQFACSFWMISSFLWLHPWPCLDKSQLLYWGSKFQTSLMDNTPVYDSLGTSYGDWMFPRKSSTPQSKLFIVPSSTPSCSSYFGPHLCECTTSHTSPSQKCRIHPWLLLFLSTPCPVNH